MNFKQINVGLDSLFLFRLINKKHKVYEVYYRTIYLEWWKSDLFPLTGRALTP